MLKKIEEQINNSAKKYSDKISYISFFLYFRTLHSLDHRGVCETPSELAKSR